MKSLLDPSFVYVPAVETDLRKTFARIRREQRKQQAQREPSPFESVTLALLKKATPK